MHSVPAFTENSPATDIAETVEAAPEPTEDLLVEEVSIDGMCGVY